MITGKVTNGHNDSWFMESSPGVSDVFIPAYVCSSCEYMYVCMYVTNGHNDSWLMESSPGVSDVFIPAYVCSSCEYMYVCVYACMYVCM